MKWIKRFFEKAFCSHCWHKVEGSGKWLISSYCDINGPNYTFIDFEGDPCYKVEYQYKCCHCNSLKMEVSTIWKKG